MHFSRIGSSMSRRRWIIASAVFLVFISLWCTSLRAQAPWTAVGPDGGDARALAAVPGHPDHLYLGTTNSWIYESTDEGASWHRLAKLDKVDDLVVDHIVADPSHSGLLYAAAWKFDRPDGGLWMSHDGGKTWTDVAGLHGQSIRTFAMAPSDNKTLFAGTLEGIFRSNDAGASWKLISPAGSKEIHEVESLAIDPANPDIVYAGTWHLPWKTTDGGKNWENIKQGVIDDSDVFSILVDPKQSNVVYASACSGIYKSETAGKVFHKVQGIPATARRTRVLRQDPVHREVVYAGTTEGLYKTTDGGKTFRRMTGPDVIVNDVYVDPNNPDRVLLATDRGGVMTSKDGAASFELSNHGFSARKVEALLIDPQNSANVYAGVVNDKTYGGVFRSTDGGDRWKQVAEGLEGRDVFALAKASDGSLLAGTNSGIFALDEGSSTWKPRNTVENTVGKPAVRTLHGKPITVEKKVKEAPHELSGRVFALDLSGSTWVAATSTGLYTSKDKAETWQGGPVMGAVDYLSVATSASVMVAAKPDSVVLSNDGGATWWPMGLPTVLTRIHRVAFSTDGTLWLGAREGVYFTRDKGKTWMWVHRLPLVGVDDLYYDAAQNKVLVSSRASDFIYAIDAKTLDWKWWQTGFHSTEVRTAGNRLMAASLDDGVLVEPAAGATETSQK
jgi:photosystem II stability/assembly factor-like uncharacterized protein